MSAGVRQTFEVVTHDHAHATAHPKERPWCSNASASISAQRLPCSI